MPPITSAAAAMTEGEDRSLDRYVKYGIEKIRSIPLKDCKVRHIPS
jgi:hypothetical protein